ncbi:sigma-70 family RNA polymerase sigma factor [Dactylosporangium fulvum]|uniref:RNA polymerase sigma factor n=1 Tax=Dactylosporangium fulvum TaxID=53359 RepID=A0ABY5VMH0_9ACTN|nr:RNA polymerase sigma factor [Dactylosporangium fulvum]UWP78873.1 RNA polymerase sigma factor [Dactylosporangium fulvum]
MPPSGIRGAGWFTGLYTAHHSQVVKYALRRLGDLDTSMDLAQEVFVVAWRRRVEVPDHSLPWLYGVARRLLANHWRARRSAPTVVPLAGDEEPAAWRGHDAGDRLGDVTAALASLPDKDQEILRLIGWEELTVTEAAVVLDCRTTTAGVRLHRARRRLAEAIRSFRAGRDSVTTAKEIRHV